MGYQHLVDMVFATQLPETFGEPERSEVHSMTRWLLPALLAELRKNLKDVSPVQDQHLVYTYCRILVTVLARYGDDEVFVMTDSKTMLQIIDAYVLLALTWVIGGVCTTDARPKFDAFLRKL